MGKEEWKNKASVNKSFLGDDEPTEHNRKEGGGKRTAEGPRRKSLPLFSFFSSSLFLDLLWTQPYTRRRAKGERRGGFLHPPPSFFGLSFAPKGGLGYRPPALPPVSPSLPLLLASTFLLPSPATAHPSKRGGGGGGGRAARKKRNMSLSLSSILLLSRPPSFLKKLPPPSPLPPIARNLPPPSLPFPPLPTFSSHPLPYSHRPTHPVAIPPPLDPSFKGARPWEGGKEGRAGAALSVPLLPSAPPETESKAKTNSLSPLQQRRRRRPRKPSRQPKAFAESRSSQSGNERKKRDSCQLSPLGGSFLLRLRCWNTPPPPPLTFAPTEYPPKNALTFPYRKRK